MENADWLKWVRRLQGISQTGLTYCNDPYDIARYTEIRQIAAEMMAGDSNVSAAASLFKVFETDTGYATPKVDIRAAVFDGERVLLVREREDNHWSLPGGWADVGDTPRATALREVKEESGYDAVIKKLAAVYDWDQHPHPPIPFHCYKLFFLCDLSGGAAQQSHETTGAGFFGENELPPLSLTRVNAEQIERMFNHHRHPELPTWFD
jgi:ADP-ribose pyrophosphatase YjhB (NUDIX family)